MNKVRNFHSYSDYSRIAGSALLFLFMIAVHAQPVITGFNPEDGRIGSTVDIYGSNFSTVPAENTVFFGEVSAVVNSASENQLNVTVPFGAKYSPISVLVNGLYATSETYFTVTFPATVIGIGSATFPAVFNLATGSAPYSAVSGDLNRDGKLDLAVVNNSENSIYFYHNNSSTGNFSFSIEGATTTSSGPLDISISDFNGDGYDDVVVVNYSIGSMSVFKNNGNSTISVSWSADYATGSSPYSAASADFDNDGKNDVVIANAAGSTVSVFRNITTGADIIFDTKTDFSAFDGPYSVVTGDIDGDGLTDIIASSYSTNTFQVFRNTSTGAGIISFSSPLAFTAGSNPFAVYCADLDNDGLKDVAVSNLAGSNVSVLKNISSPGSISFSTQIVLATGASPYDISGGDIDGDGYAELVVANYNSNSASVLWNYTGYAGSLTFDTNVDFITGAAPVSSEVADLDGDGKMEVTIANTSSNTISILRNEIISQEGQLAADYSFSANVNDQSSYGNHATQFGGTYVDDRSFNTSGALNFNGASDYLIVPYASQLQFGSGTSFAISGWFNTTSALNGTLVDLSDGFTGFAGSTLSDGSLYVVLIQDGVGFADLYSSQTGYNDGKWHHFVFQADRYNGLSMYVDGELENSNSTITTGLNISIAEDLLIGVSGETGNTNLNTYFQGDLDDIKFFSGVLSEEEISEEYHQNGWPASGIAQASVYLQATSNSTIDLAREGSLSDPNSWSKVVSITESVFLSFYFNGDLTTYGDYEPDGIAEEGGTAIALGPGIYYIQISAHDNSYQIQQITSVGLTGSARTGDDTGWNDPDTDFSDLGNGQYQLQNVALFNGEFKIRANDTWGQGNWGDDDSDNILEIGGANITVSEGIYDLNFDIFSSTLAISLSPVAVTGFSPSSGPIGTSVVISGSNFSTTAADNRVYFGSIQASVSSATATSLTASVPSGASYSPISIIVNGLTATSTQPFIVTFTNPTDGIDSNSFGPKSDPSSTSTASYGLAEGDFDGDGKTDLAVTNYNTSTVSIYRNITSGFGQPTYAAEVNFTTGLNPFGITSGDFNNDGKPDIATANYGTTTVSVFLNTSTSTGVIAFTDKLDFTVGSAPNSVTVADFDRDGKLDLAAANTSSNSASVLRNSFSDASTVSFSDKVDYTTGAFPYSIAQGDIDGDNKPDLIVANGSSSTISVFRNNSSGTGNVDFAASVDFAAGTNPFAVGVADLDGDSKLDVLVANASSSSVSLFLNTGTSPGTINLAAKSDFATGPSPRSLDLNDFDGDGLVDIAVGNYSGNSISILRNTNSASGTLSFASTVDFATGANPYGIVSGDFDLDSKPDLATANISTLPVSVIRNTSKSATYARYTFSGGSVDDSEAGGFNGTVSSGALFSTDRYGYGFSSFEPENNGAHISISHAGAWDFNSAFTLTGWIRTNREDISTSNFNILFDIGDFGQLYIQDNHLTYNFGDGSYVASVDGNLNYTLWDFVAISVDAGNTMRFYINGVEQRLFYSADSGELTYGKVISKPLSSSVQFYIASPTTDLFWNGSIDDVRIYTGSSLSEQEILDIYNSEKPEDQRITFSFDEGSLLTGNGYGYQGNFLTVTNTSTTPITTTDRFGNTNGAILFQDNGDHIDVFHERSLNLRNNVTVNMWVKATELPVDPSLGDALISDNSGGRLFILPSGAVAYHYPANEGTTYPIIQTANGLVTANTWKMVSMTISDDDQIAIYVDGISQTLTKTDSAPVNISDYTSYGNPDRFILAYNDVADTDNRFFNGAMDDVSIYQKVLNPDEIKQLFRNGDARLVAYYPFDGDARDYSGRGFDGTVSGALLSADRFGDSDKAYAFDGVDDQITNSSLSLPSSEVTFAAWINFKDSDVSGYHPIIEFGNDAPIFDIANGYLELYSAPATDILVPTNQWVHVAGTYSGGNVILYINGEVAKSTTGSVSLSGVGMGIGWNGTDIPFEGDIDEVRIYSVALSEAEVLDIYTLEAQTFLPPPSPTFLTAQVAGPNSVALYWTDNAIDETGYSVEVVQGGTTLNTFELGKDATYAFVTDLTTNTEYTFNVLVTNNYGIGASSVNSTPIALPTPIVTAFPSVFALNDQVTITYFPDRSYSPGELTGATKIYFHSGLVPTGNGGSWDPLTVIGNWGADDGIGLMTKNTDGSWSITITPTTYYGVDLTYDIAQIGMVFRDETGTNVGKGVDLSDIYIDVFNPNNLNRPVSESMTFDGVESTHLIANATDPGNSIAWSDMTNFTIEAWVNLDQFPAPGNEAEVLARWRDYTNAPFIAYRLLFYDPNDSSGPELRADISNGNAGSYSFTAYKLGSGFLGKYHHLAASYNGSFLRLFIDGILVAEQASTIILPTTEGPDESIYAGYKIDGEIDEVRLWATARTTSEIRQTIEETITNTGVSGLRGYWPLDVVVTSGSEKYTPDGTSNQNNLYLKGNVQVNELPDLSVAITDQLSLYTIGEAGSIQVTLSNNSPSVAAIASGVVNKLYLSADDILDLGDVELASNSIELNLAASGTQTQTVNFTIPGTTDEGSYQFIVVVDYTGILDESEEGNNQAIGSAVTISNTPPLSAPANLVAAAVTISGFTLSWGVVTDADQYEYAVSTDQSFNSFVKNPTIITTTSIAITQLEMNTRYFYRVKALDTSTSRESTYSTGNVTTLTDTQAPTVSISSPVAKVVPQSVTVTITTTDNVGVEYIDFYKKPALATSFESTTVFASTIATSQQFEATIEAGDFDDVGVSFYAIAFDETGNESGESALKTIVRDIPSSEIQTVSNIEVGRSAQDYQMIAMPYESTSVTEIIGLPTDDNVWRISTWTGSQYNYSVSSFTAGKGYWLIIDDPGKTTLSFNNVSPVAVDEYFTILLNTGWNQIGNPFLKPLLWSEVLLHNQDRGEITSTDLTELFTYDRGYTTLNGTLEPYEGAFVFSNSNISLQIPISALSANRITREVAQPRTSITQNGGWELIFDFVMPDNLRYGVAGLGQVTGSEDDVDPYDLHTPILFNHFVKAEFEEEANLARSIHSMKSNDTWTMALSCSYKEGTPIRMIINGAPDLDFNESFVMLDLQNGRVREIIGNEELTVKYKPGMTLKFIKGDQRFIEAEKLSSLLSISDPYPNPSTGRFDLSIHIPDVVQLTGAKFELIDLSGKKLLTLNQELGSGHNEIRFNLESVHLESGMYFIEVSIGGSKITKKVYLKRKE